MGRKHSNFSDGRCNGGSTVFDIDEIRKICRKESIKWRKRKKINVTYEDVDLTVKELVQELTKKQIPVLKYHVKQPLLDLAIIHDIPITKVKRKGGVESWVGKPKGMYDIAFERGLLDLDTYCVEDYTVKGGNERSC